MRVVRMIVSLGLVACGAPSSDSTSSSAADRGFDTVAADTADPLAVVCSTGTFWTGGDRESPRMHPGRACVSCHQDHRGPKLTVGGTVYRTLREPDDCNGARNVTVEVIGADDVVTTLTTNDAGNFYLRGGSVTFPIRARVTKNGVTSEMVTPQDSGDCNACHTQQGADKAPGRILKP